MHRLTPALLTAVLITVALASVATVALAAVPSEPASLASPAEFAVSIHMTDRPDGEAMRTFVSSTSRITAVISFMDANNVAYQLRLRDLVGLEVYNKPVRLDGDGQIAREIAIEDFVSSYRAREAEERDALSANVSALEGLCDNPPGAPQATPVPTPGAPTSVPDPFERWRAMTLDEIVSARTTGVELDRTLRATGSLPDMQDVAGAVDDLEAAHDALADTLLRLENAERALTPAGTGPGTPTPSPPPLPDPGAACTEVGLAVIAANETIARTQAAFAAIPDDTSDWRIPPTTALYDGEQFKSCQPYVTQLYDAVQGTPATSTSWTIGEPGSPALIFPSPDEVGQTDVGTLGLHLPEGANALYASTVKVPGVNRTAGISAFVTDAQCIPVNGVTMTFGFNPSNEGHTVTPSTAVVLGGEVATTLMTGFTPTLGSEVLGIVDVPGAPGEPGTTKVGRKQFNVIGPTMDMRMIVHPKTINPRLGERAGIGVRVVDYYGRNVADGTTVTVSIAAGDPGVLATDIVNASGETESLLLGKSVEMVTLSGNALVPDGDDPGVIYRNNLYLLAGSEGDGIVEIIAAADGAQKSVPVTIRTAFLVYLPIALRVFDVMATPPYSTTPVPPEVLRPANR